jgi:tRNA(Ile)-lysidine synthase
MASSRKASAARGLDPNAADDPVANVDRTVADWLLTRSDAGGMPSEPALLIIAFSGGLDSSVLLDALVRQRAGGSQPCPQDRPQHGPNHWSLHAVHVHHGLQPAANAWPEHCRAFAEARGVVCETLRVRIDARRRRREGLEGAARAARYEAIAERARALGARAVLTAHHADDQLETLLMRLARGTGLDGLGAIADDQAWPQGGEHCRLWRPLLGLSRATLERSAVALKLSFVQDPSNTDEAMTRNAVRQQVMPALDRALPNWRSGFLRARTLLDEANNRLKEQTRADLLQCQLADHQHLNAVALAGLSGPRRRAVWRAWFDELNLRMPPMHRLDAIDRSLALSASGEALHEGWTFRRWRDKVVASPAVSVIESIDPPTEPGDVNLVWRGEPLLQIEAWGGWLVFNHDTGRDRGIGIDPDWLRGQSLRVTAQRSAASLRIAPKARSRTLKGLYQSAAIPPWVRLGLPLVFVGDDLVYAAGLGMNCTISQKMPGGLVLDWRPAEPLV